MNGIKFAGINGALAVGIGAFGAHGLKGKVSEYGLEVFKTGSHYHLIHAIVILVIAVGGGMFLEDKRKRTILSLFHVGTWLFAGSLYALAITNLRWLGAITPLGGVCFILGWLLLAFSARQPSASSQSD